GFSLDDAYIREQLEYIHKIYKGGADSFYILLRRSEIEKANLPEYVTPIPFSDFGKPLEDLIEELSNIANGNNTPPKPPTEPINPKDALKNHFNVPFASKGNAFVGREGLREKIWESLSRSGRAAIGQAVSIKGIGGLGKTQLAVEYAHAYRERYENGVFWLTADEDINIQLIKIGEDLNWISQFDTGFDQAELVRNRFRKLSGCLIIFDNVDERKAIENYLPESGARAHSDNFARETGIFRRNKSRRAEPRRIAQAFA
ncbi:MAG TPA: NB-ARC domain-containing protein, partial [Pyrinomonadaceae bacterium]|nr:NB-ARC domain-containing protein [Pyrinomonadaceae bacterium]